MPSTVKTHLADYIGHYVTAIVCCFSTAVGAPKPVLLETGAIILVLDMSTKLHLQIRHTLVPSLAAGFHSCLAFYTLLCAAAGRKLQALLLSCSVNS